MPLVYPLLYSRDETRTGWQVVDRCMYTHSKYTRVDSRVHLYYIERGRLFPLGLMNAAV